MSNELVPVTSWSRNRRHLARPDDLKPCSDGVGRYGSALCDSQIYTDVYDQDWLDGRRMAWFGKEPGTQLIVNLPPCKRCEKKSAAMGPEVSS